MKSIEIASIIPGTTAPCDYYSDRGELLLARGAVISSLHLDALRRRNIFEVHARVVSEQEEIQMLLSKEYGELGDIECSEIPADPVIPPSLATIQKGKSGFEQLGRDPQAADLDEGIRKNRTADRPVGPALKGQAAQISVQERTEEYKKNVSGQYQDALRETMSILTSLSKGARVDGTSVKKIVDRFVTLFITDRNILLNLSGTKPADREFLHHHSLNVCLLSINIAASIGYSRNQVVEIGVGALLHDVGMLLIAPEIRAKQGRLSEEEWYEVQKHPILGLHILEKVSRLPESVPYISYQVHERENGTGYPKQRGGRFIHRFAKIVQVADIYEALTAPRAHRKPYLPFEAMVRIIKMSQTGLIFGDFVKSFLEYASLYPVGSFVELTDGRIGKVVHANKQSLGKPVISILTDSRHDLLGRDRITQEDLAANPGVQIKRALPGDCLESVELMDGF